MPKKPSPPRNSGHSFESQIQTTLDAYEASGVAYLAKVDPPTKVFGRKVIFLANPFLDFVGVWTANGGKAIMIELKHNEKAALPILGHNVKGDGIKATQLASAKRWQAGGAAVAYLWRRGDEVRIFTPAMVGAAALSRKSILWIDTHRVPQGQGFVLIDFLSMLEPLTKRMESPTLENA